MSDFWTSQDEIITVDKNKKEVIKAFKCERQEKEYIELRIFTRNNEDDTEHKLTKKGIVIPKEMWNIITEKIDIDVFNIDREK